MYLPLVGDGRRGSEATERGEGVCGGGIPLPDQGVFALWGFKLSNLCIVYCLYCLFKLDPNPDRFLKWGMADDGAKRSNGVVFAFWGFKLCDLVHTLGEFVRLLSV